MRRIHWTFPAAALCLVGAVVTGCVLLQPASPTTTVTDASGVERTLRWADYPGDGHAEPAEVLAAPRAEHVEAAGEALLDRLQLAADAAQPGLDWEQDGESGVYPHGGNGYGGPTLHRTHNSASRTAEQPPRDWDAMATALETALAAEGYGPIEWEFEREPWVHETPAERDAAVAEQFGSLDPAEMWSWAGWARNGSVWVDVFFTDVSRGTLPAGARPYLKTAISLSAGATVIAAADEPAYRAGVAPFEGLERPEPTDS